MTCGESPGDSTSDLIDILSWDEVSIEVCPTETWMRPRAARVNQPAVGGLPTILTGDVGGRVYSLSIPVTSDEEKDDLEDLLSGAYVVYTPALREEGTFAIETLTVTPDEVPHCWTIETTFHEIDPEVI